MVKWKNEITYILQNYTKEEDDIYFRIEFDLYSSLYDKINYYFIITRYPDNVLRLFIWHGKNKITVRWGNVTNLKEHKFLNNIINYYARKMYQDDLLKVYGK